MSTTVKVFVVLNLIMSLAFMFVQMTVFATRENWKRRWHEDTKQLTDELKSAGTIISKVTYDRVKAENNLVVFENKLRDTQADLKTRIDEITTLNQNIQNLNQTIRKNEISYNALNENFMAQSKSLEQVRQRNTELTHIAQVARAVAFNLNVKLAEVEDDLNNEVTKNTEAAEKIASLEKDLEKNKAIVGRVMERNPELYRQLVDEKASTALLQAVVAAVRVNPQGQQDLVMLSIGADSKVEEGIEFIVFRGNQYICKVRVERIMADMAACRVIPESWNDKKIPVQQGDLAQNRL